MDMLFPSPPSVLSLTLIGILFGVVLSIAKLKLKVDKDPRILLVEAAFPGANCGACGEPGCGGYAKKIVNEGMDFTLCPVGGEEVVGKIAEIMGVEAPGAGKKMIAAVHCCGGDDVTVKRFIYNGPRDCRALHETMGGDKICAWGCLGQADCVAVCPFDAIHMGPDNIPYVDRQACTGCNKCVEICPRNIISLVPEEFELRVMCLNEEKGAVMKKGCTVGCIGCKICEKVCREEVFADNPDVDSAIKVENFIAVIDYNHCTNCLKCVEVCPVPVIHPIELSKKFQKEAAKRAEKKEAKAAEPVA